jgi:hypothetical protein
MLHRPLYQGMIVFLMAMTLAACQNKEGISGKVFIERGVLVDMLVDIHLADGVSNDRKFHRKFDVDSIDIFSPILDKYQISREMFDTTMFVYSRNPEQLDQVYNDVLIKLNVMLDENRKDDPPPSTPEG